MGGVFLIDDDEDLLGALGDLIALISHRPCLTVGSLADLIAVAARALECELGIVDVNLGVDEPSGLDVYDWLRAQRFAGRIVFLSGHAPAHPLVQKACRLGHAQVFRKPIDVSCLRAVIEGQPAVARGREWPPDQTTRRST
jgi:FixJ family two-component response regulator